MAEPTPFVANLLLFGRLLRSAGVDVGHSRVVDAVRALEVTGVRARLDVRATLRALLVHRHDDLARFDQAFDLFFRAPDSVPSTLPLFSIGERPRVVARRFPEAALDIDRADGRTVHGTTLAVGAYSAVGVSRTRDFADFSDDELEQARRMLMNLPWQLGVRTTRRWERSSGERIDLRAIAKRTVARGELFKLPRRRRRRLPRPLVLIGDVSGSMARYSRVLLHFVYGLAHGTDRVESFVFATELTRITRPGRRVRNDADLARVIRGIADWGGGTRIGHALRTFNTQWSRRVMRHGPVVLIVSDGWDRGDPAVLGREMARLRRSCRRLIWLNPLLGSPSYEPLTRGMRAALGHVDDFLPAHNLASLEQLAVYLRTLSPRGRGVAPGARKGLAHRWS